MKGRRLAAKRAKPGDMFEIITNRGLTYMQCTHRHREYGHLVRVLRGFFEVRPENLSELVSKEAAFATFFPLDAALKRGVVTLVSKYPIPPRAVGFPVFRAGIPDPATGKVGTWWSWDGEKEWKVGAISEGQRSMPIREILTLPALLQKMEDEWTPECDPE
jgi:hypothetical protein